MSMTTLLPWPFDREYMQLALVAGLTVGACAPLIGAFLVQKRMSLMGDGVGHLAFAGVAAGLLAGQGYQAEGVQLQASRLKSLPGGNHRLAAQNPVFVLWGRR